MPDVLIYGDTVRHPELRHEVPLTLGDPFLYLEKDGARYILVTEFEWPRIQEAGVDAELISPFTLGLDELMDKGLRYWQITLELAARAVEKVGVAKAVVPPTFPLGLAEHLRGSGVELTVERDLFVDRRRVKNDTEIAGIKRAQRAAEAGMDAARDLFRRVQQSNGALAVDGEALTSERVKHAMVQAFLAHGCTSEEFIVSHGPQSAIGHDMGSGEIKPSEPIVIDVWPKDAQTACFADMTRTFCIGEIPQELLDYHRVAKDSLDRSLAAIKEGVKGAEVFAVSCEPFHDAGYKTMLTKEPGEVIETGYFHSLGHGVGLEVHEQPGMGRVGEELRSGDVVTVEPGMYRRGWGGCRLEDLVLVTKNGAENLTQYPYDLEP